MAIHKRQQWLNCLGIESVNPFLTMLAKKNKMTGEEPLQIMRHCCLLEASSLYNTGYVMRATPSEKMDDDETFFVGKCSKKSLV